MPNCDWELKGDTLYLRAGGETFLPDASSIFSFIFSKAEGINGLTPVGFFPADSSLKFDRFPLPLILNVHLERGQTEFSFEVGVKAGCGFHPLPDFFDRKADHVVVNNRWFPVDKGSLEELKTILHGFGVDRVGPLPLGVFLKLKGFEDLVILDDFSSLQKPEEIIRGLSNVLPSEYFSGTLYPYQTDGFHWLSFIDNNNLGCILGDEMGLGKTIQIIALLANHAGSGKTSLIICPATLLENWSREFSKFAPSIKTVIHRGASRAGWVKRLLAFDVVITSYETAVRDRYMLCMHSWDLVVLDEVQAIKNPQAIRTEAVKSLPRRCSIAVTGTPVQNNLVDLWSIVDFVYPGYFGDLASFKKTYEMNLESARELEPRLTPLLLRRTLDDVSLELPELIEIPQPLRLDLRGCREYSRLRDEIVNKYPSSHSLVMLTYLRRYCAHRNLVMDEKSDMIAFSPKYNRVLEILEEIFTNNQKTLVFTSWTNMIDMLVSDIRNRFGVYTDLLDGRTPVSERQSTVENFNNVSSPAVLIMNPIAGGTGLNITGASHVLHYNLEWNPAVIDQATARAYRIGQKRPVRVHIPYYIDTVEEVIMDRLNFKRSVADNAVVGVRGQTDDYQDIIRALGKTPVIDQEG